MTDTEPFERRVRRRRGYESARLELLRLEELLGPRYCAEGKPYGSFCLTQGLLILSQVLSVILFKLPFDSLVFVVFLVFFSRELKLMTGMLCVL